jgi:dynein heavy chain
MDAIAPYLEDPNFNAEYIRGKSAAAAGLCGWVVNVVGYYKVYCDVEPKRMALLSSNTELQLAQERLEGIQSKIAQLDGNSLFSNIQRKS